MLIRRSLAAAALSVLVTATAVHPAPAPASADEVLAAWARALGGRDRLAAVSAIHVRSQLALGGMKGTFETWDTARGQHRDRTEIPGVLQQDQVYDGRRAWVRDPSGKVHELSGADLEDQVATAHQASFSCLLPGRMAGEVSLAAEDPARSAIVLAIRPQGGKPYTVYLDEQTFLPTRLEQPEGDHTLVQTFADWRDVQGVQIPWQVRQSTGDPRYDVLFSVESVEIDPPLEPGLFEAPAESVAAVRFAPGHDVAEFPFELYGFHIFVPVAVNGKGPSAFILDSGADASAIVRERAQALGLEFQGSLEGGGVGGSTEMGLIPDVTLGLPGVEVPTHVIAVFPAADHSEAFGTRVEGVLGYDVISRFVVRIDYVRKTLAFYDPAKFEYHGSGTSLPVTFTRNCITVPGTITIAGRRPIETQIMVDIGSGGTIDLNSPFVAANDLVRVLGKTIPGASHGVGGRSVERVGRLESVRFGPYALARPYVSLAQDTRGSAALSDYVARAGARLFSRFTVYLDYPGRRLILEPNAHLHDAFEYDMSGLELAARGAGLDRIVVTGVFPDSPASRAGFRPGDILSTVDGRSAAELRLAKILELFSAGERTVPLIVERDGRPVKIALKLRRRI